MAWLYPETLKPQSPAIYACLYPETLNPQSPAIYAWLYTETLKPQSRRKSQGFGALIRVSGYRPGVNRRALGL